MAGEDDLFVALRVDELRDPAAAAFIGIRRGDYPVIQAVTIYLAVITMLVNLGTDVLYKLVDPRVVLK